MANRRYDLANQAFANGEIDWTNDTFRAYLIDLNDYTPNFATDEFLDDIPAAAKVANATMVNTTVSTSGVCDADDTTFTTISGDVSEAIVIAKWTGAEATSRLIAYIDTATGLPATPDGGDITVRWDDGADKIFKL